MKKIIKFVIIIILARAVLGACVSTKESKPQETAQPQTSQQTSQLEQKEEKPAETTAQTPAPQKEEKPAETAPAETAATDTIRPELKAFLESYESFMDEYCDFMKNYNVSDLSMLSKYTTFMEKYLDLAKKAEAWEGKDLNDAETLYYVQVMNRVSEKLLKAGLSM